MYSMVEMGLVREPARDWRDRAACLEEDPELFFPDGTSSLAVLEQIAEAKLVCSGCPALARCRSWALESGVEFGVWGGLDEGERQALRRAERRAARRAVA